jgi:thiazole synthase
MNEPNNPTENDSLVIGGRTFSSRLFVGTGKYASVEQTRAAIRASGANVATVAVRRVDLKERGAGSLFGMLLEEKFDLLPNTAACYTADDAIRTARLGRELSGSDMVKLEVIGDPKTLFPDVVGLLEATKVLVKEGFFVLPYTNDDPITAKKLVDLGCPAVMPLGAPIGSGLGIRNPYNLRILMETVSVPVIVDAGVGTASDAAIAMELGCDGVLMNTAIAAAKDPIRMAHAMRLAVDAGRLAHRAGRMDKRLYANASSPLHGTIASTRGHDALGIE